MKQNSDPIAAIKRTGQPATICLIALVGLIYVAAWVTKSPLLSKELAYIVIPPTIPHPWAPLTYPFASSGSGSELIWELLLLWWMYWVGGSTEREIGSAKVVYIFFLAGVLGATFVTIAWTVFGRAGALAGTMIPVGALTVIWGTRNPTADVRIYGIIPVAGKWIAIIDAALVLFVVGDGFIPAGVMALVPLGLAWAYAANRLPGIPYGRGSGVSRKAAKANERRSQAYYDDVYNRTKEREERERLRKLFESSLSDEDKDK